MNTRFFVGAIHESPVLNSYVIWRAIHESPLRVLQLFSRQTNDTLDVGQEYKRYIFVPKTGGVTTKGIFLYIACIVVQTQPPNFMCDTF